MGRLIYSVIASVDGYVNDVDGGFDWAAPGEDVHRFVNDLERNVGTYLYGRRLWDTMRFWGTPAAVDGQPEVMRDYAEIWRSADKVIYSSTLAESALVEHAARARLEQRFEPDAVARVVADAPGDVSIGGATIAGEALRAGLVEEIHLISVPAIVGGGTPAFSSGVRLTLELIGEDRFSDGTVHTHYRVLS